MPFSFGAAAQPAQAQPQTSLFGNNQASTSTSSPFGAASGVQTQAAPSGGLFGNANAGSTNTGGGLFGSQNKPAFGNTATQSGGGLFGNTQATGTGGTTGGLFGSANQGTSTGGGLFGSQQNQQPAQSGGLFGSTTQNQTQAAPSGGLFGSTAQQPTQSGGLFGSTTTQPQQQQGGGLFGSTTQQPSGGLFGSTTQAQQPSGGLFGNASTTGGGLFGSKPAQPSGGLFGSAQQSALGASAAPQGGLFGSTAPPQNNMLASTSQPLASSMVKQEQDVESRMTAIHRAWDVNSPECRFKAFFYNVVDPGTAPQYGRPPNATDDAKWARAVRDNPDPANMVPVVAVGWGDVQKRVQAQEQTASVHQQRVKELSQALGNLNRQTTLQASVRLQALQMHLQQISQRLLHLAALSPSFAPVTSSTFRTEEGNMRCLLDEVKDTLDGRSRPSQQRGVGLTAPARNVRQGRMMGQINELWGAVEEVRRLKKLRGSDGQQWAGDDRLLAELAVVLEQQQTALAKLTKLANDAVFDADVMRAGLGAVEGRK